MRTEKTGIFALLHKILLAARLVFKQSTPKHTRTNGLLTEAFKEVKAELDNNPDEFMARGPGAPGSGKAKSGTSE